MITDLMGKRLRVSGRTVLHCPCIRTPAIKADVSVVGVDINQIEGISKAGIDSGVATAALSTNHPAGLESIHGFEGVDRTTSFPTTPKNWISTGRDPVRNVWLRGS